MTPTLRSMGPCRTYYWLKRACMVLIGRKLEPHLRSCGSKGKLFIVTLRLPNNHKRQLFKAADWHLWVMDDQ